MSIYPGMKEIYTPVALPPQRQPLCRGSIREMLRVGSLEGDREYAARYEVYVCDLPDGVLAGNPYVQQCLFNHR